MAEEQEKEATNLDQTDFIDNSSFAFSDEEVFPSAQEISEVAARAVPDEAKVNQTKKPLLNKQLKLLLIAGGGVVGLLLIILVVALLSGGNGNGPIIGGPVRESRTEIAEINRMVGQLNELEKSLVLPQIREAIVP